MKFHRKFYGTLLMLKLFILEALFPTLQYSDVEPGAEDPPPTPDPKDEGGYDMKEVLRGTGLVAKTGIGNENAGGPAAQPKGEDKDKKPTPPAKPKPEGEPPAGDEDDSEFYVSTELTEEQLGEMTPGVSYELADGFFLKGEDGKLQKIQDKEPPATPDPDKKPEVKPKGGDKTYQIGNKHLPRTELAKELNEFFKFKDFDFNTLPDEAFEKYAELYSKAKDGENKEEWQKKYTQRDQLAKKERENLASAKAQLDNEKFENGQRIANLQNQINELKTQLKEEIDPELSQTEREDIISERAVAKVEVKNKEKQLEAEQSQKKRLYFYESLNLLQTTFPELYMDDDFQTIINENMQGKRADDDPAVVHANILFGLINDSIDANTPPDQYYRRNKWRYKIEGTVKPEQNFEELISKSEKLKKKQDSNTYTPPGSMGIPGSGQPSQKKDATGMGIVPGDNKKSKVSFLVSGGE